MKQIYPRRIGLKEKEKILNIPFSVVPYNKIFIKINYSLFKYYQSNPVILWRKIGTEFGGVEYFVNNLLSWDERDEW